MLRLFSFLVQILILRGLGLNKNMLAEHMSTSTHISHLLQYKLMQSIILIK